MKRLVIFDLDGTLLNTLGGIGGACNDMLKSFGFATFSTETYKIFSGNGIRKLVERALPEKFVSSREFVDLAQEKYLSIYRDNLLRDTEPYSGIPELLKELSSSGVKMAVASNKFDDGTKNLVAANFPDIFFVAVEGQKPGAHVKPDPKIVMNILDNVGIMPDDVLYVGDTSIDMETARNAGVESVGVTWGFRSREELESSGACHLADKPSEILNWI